jgi:hypothetical protein
MRLAAFLAVAGLFAFAAPARAELPDCATFPGDRAKFACYDNVSRAPKPDPEVKPAAARVKPATPGRKARPRQLACQDKSPLTPARRRWP